MKRILIHDLWGLAHAINLAGNLYFKQSIKPVMIDFVIIDEKEALSPNAELLYEDAISDDRRFRFAAKYIDTGLGNSHLLLAIESEGGVGRTIYMEPFEDISDAIYEILCDMIPHNPLCPIKTYVVAKFEEVK